MHALTVLMWKHWTVRRRRFIHTILELGLTLMFFALAYSTRSLYAARPKHLSLQNNNASRNIFNTEPFSLKYAMAPSIILYLPVTPLTDSLMNEVGRQLNLDRLPYYSASTRSGYYGLSSNESQISRILESLTDYEAVVIFQNIQETENEWPRRLNYTIRMRVDYMTHVYEALDDMNNGPHERFGVIYEPFIRLQWAIDSSYLQFVSGKPVNKTLWLQQFPYAEAPRVPMAVTVSMIIQALCFLSIILPFVFLMSRLMAERASGVQELIKMVGVSQWMLNMSHFLNAVPTGLVYSVGGAILLKVSATPLIANTSGTLIFLALALHYCTVVSLAFVCSYITESTQYATTLSVLAAVVTWLPSRLIADREAALPRLVVWLTGLLPHVPLSWFWTEVGALEQYEQGVTVSSMWRSHTARSGSALLALVMLALQAVGLFGLGWYLGMVRPGRYGVARPWDFPCRKRSSRSSKPKVCAEEEDLEPSVQDPRYFEPPPSRADVGIHILNVSKTFGKQRALWNVSFEVLRGEITVLLGHNGAGKTTLMSIITGMYSASEGRVLVNGEDSVTHQTAVRKQLGLCPQHNLFFPDLTVLEHVVFFSMLKGQSRREAASSSHELLRKLGIDSKANAQSGQLSGGMKRRLQLSCALAGGASVLVLDEPTSGLDVETRRELWDLLLSLRGSRTVLLTTHFMEEADALGDRVAALHGGRLRCHATPMFLKKSIGTGYRLSLTTIGMPHEQRITDTVVKHVPDANLQEKGVNTVLYVLPARHHNRFPALFAALESQRSDLALDTIGVGVSTLEEVFLKLCSNVETTFSQDYVDGSAPEPTYKKLRGPRLWLSQCRLLVRRHIKYLYSKKLNFLCVQVLIPIALLFAFTSMCNNSLETISTKPNLELSMDLDIYDEMADRRVMYSIDNDPTLENDLKRVTDKFPKVRFERTSGVASAVLESAMKDMSEYLKYLVGVEINGTDAKALYTTTVRHTAPVALNLLSNLIAVQSLPWADGRTITTYNHPIQGDIIALRNRHTIESKSLIDCGMWTIFVVFIILMTAQSAISLPCVELLSGARHIHIMAGCSPLLHWGSTVTFYTTLYSAILVVPAILAALALDKDSTLNREEFLGVMLVILLLGLLSYLALAFLITFFLRERPAGFVLLVLVMILGVLPAMVYTSAEIFRQPLGWYEHVLATLRYLVPPYTVTSAVFRATYVVRLDAYCDLNKANCPELQPAVGFDVYKCCVSNVPQSCYFCLKESSPGKDMLIMLVQFIVYMSLVTLAQHGLFSDIVNRIMSKRYKPPPHRYSDEIVRAERAYVAKANTLPIKQIPDAMLVDDVHKTYWGCFRSHQAVKGISFSVKKGECFGVLGVNGAGKSTTFKMITGETGTTRGTIFGNGHRLKWPREKYLQSLGYCPQFFGLDSFLTGRENLTTLLTLRGLSAADVATEVKAWITVVGLEKYTDVAVRRYSGGCTRRLAAAAALSGGAPLALLDEPSAGVDAAARRGVWAALRRAQAAGRSVVITSHSMDEMEALCARIGIVSRGELAALGSPAALRASHAAGHAVRLKLRTVPPPADDPAPASDVTDGASLSMSNAASHSVDDLKQQLHHTFDCTLKDEHKTMLHYHINETMRYSELFEQLEQLCAAFTNLIEDYSVTETTLEEVFLSFAHDATDSASENASKV